MKRVISISLIIMMFMFSLTSFAQEDTVLIDAEIIEIIENEPADNEERETEGEDVNNNNTEEDTDSENVNDNEAPTATESVTDDLDNTAIDETEDVSISLETEAPENISDVDMLASNTNRWTDCKYMSKNRAGAKAFSINGELYVVGGRGVDTAADFIEKYSPQTDSWTVLTDSPNIAFGYSTAVMDNKIYIIGGYRNDVYLNEVNIYDIDTGEWTAGASMNTCRSEAAAVTAGDRIYVFGGRNLYGFVNDYEYYDMSDGKWHTVTTDFPQSMIRVDADIKYMNGYIFMYGGVNQDYENEGVSAYSVDDLNDEQNIIEDGYEEISMACGQNKAVVFMRNGNTYSAKEIVAYNGYIEVHDSNITPDPGGRIFSEYIIFNGYLYNLGGHSYTYYNNNVQVYSEYLGDYSEPEKPIIGGETISGNSVTIKADEGKTYMFFINVNNIADLSEYVFKIEYSPNNFSIEDICALTAKKDLDVGAIEGTNIEILSVDEGGISFKVDEAYDKPINGTVNAIKLKSNFPGRKTLIYALTKPENEADAG